LASILIALSPNIDTLIAGRALQGIGFGMSFPLIIAINFHVFPPKERAFAVSVAVGISGLAQIIGPFIGGLILQYWTWRGIFLINVPIGILDLLLIWMVMPKQPNTNDHDRIDWIGALLLTVALLGILVAITEASQWGIISWLFLICLAAGIFLLVMFVLFEKKQKHPLVDLSLFKINLYRLSALIRILCTFVYCSFLFLMPLYLQSILSKTPLRAGIIFLIMNAGFASVSLFNGKLINRVGKKGALGIAFLLYFIFLITTIIAVSYGYLWLLYFSLFVQGLTASIMVVTTVTFALGSVSKKKSGLASGLFYTIGTLGFSVSIAVVGSLLASVSNHYLIQKINGIALTTVQFFKLRAVAHGLHSVKTLVQVFPAQLADRMMLIAKHAFTFGFISAMILNLILIIVAAILWVRMKDRF